ncbi:MAG: glycosyltransferase family 4 protein [Roseateles sp.]|nr:glycosyltransferase family 4 protein [Burkholderiaceae bacterium]
MSRPRVAVLQHRLLHYRLGLFEQLRIACESRGLDLQLIHGDATPTEAVRKDTGTLPWATTVKNRVWNVAGRDLLWQPFREAVQGCDLVVLMQESRLLSNYPWLFGWGPRATRVAYWGHGRNFQSEAPSGWRERWKQRMLTSVDWWFAYTEMTADIVCQAGFPAERVTVLNNAIDNRSFENDLASVSDDEVRALRASIGAADDACVGLYCGSLYPDKRLELMLAACEQVVARQPSFRMVVIGDGPSRPLLEQAMQQPWFHWVGARRGREKAAWFRASQLFLNPGLVGLHILDSFVAGAPMITTRDAKHSPEVAYLRDGINGLVTDGNAQAYASAVLGLVEQPERREALARQARADAAHYTLDAMVTRFADGLAACVGAPRLR